MFVYTVHTEILIPYNHMCYIIRNEMKPFISPEMEAHFQIPPKSSALAQKQDCQKLVCLLYCLQINTTFMHYKKFYMFHQTSSLHYHAMQPAAFNVYQIKLYGQQLHVADTLWCNEGENMYGT